MEIENLGAQTDNADFSNPLAMIHACHQRIRRFCRLLHDAGNALQQHGANQDFVTACKHIHHYFSTAGKLHHQDEENDIFPLVIRTSLKIAELIHQLKQEHQQLDQLWESLAPLLQSARNLSDPDQFIRLANDYAALAVAHLDKEEEEFLPVIQHLLSSEQLEKIGHSMALRRKLAFPQPGL